MHSVSLPNKGKIFSAEYTAGRFSRNQTHLLTLPQHSEGRFIKPETVLRFVIFWNSAAVEQWRRTAGNSKQLRQEGSGDIQVSALRLSSPISQAKLEV